MNLHLLPADDKLFIPEFVRMVNDNQYVRGNILMCYMRELTISNTTLPYASPKLLIGQIRDKSINRLIFHSLQPPAYSLIKVLRENTSEIRIDWVYWGESYGNSSWLLSDQTLVAYMKKYMCPYWLSKLLVKTKIAQKILDARATRFRNYVSKYAEYVDTMYHWSHIDYDYIRVLLSCGQLKYRKFFYDVFSFPSIGSDLIEREEGYRPSQCIVLGHSASMRNNHLDILPAIVDYVRRNNKVLVIPLAYGDAKSREYVDKIEEYVSRVQGLLYHVLKRFYPLADYLNFLSKCGAYIAPAKASIGAGNMISYAQAGGIPITSNENSAGLFLNSLGAEVAIYGGTYEIPDLIERVFGAHSQKNQSIIGNYFSLKDKSECYNDLLATV